MHSAKLPDFPWPDNGTRCGSPYYVGCPRLRLMPVSHSSLRYPRQILDGPFLADAAQPRIKGHLPACTVRRGYKDKQSALSIAAPLNPEVGRHPAWVPCPAAAALWRGEEAGDAACGKKERACRATR